jgi:hypothetical protein
MIQLSETVLQKHLVYAHQFRALFLVATLPLLLLACAGEKQNLVYDTFKLGISNPNAIIDETPLNPAYRYLKVDANGQPALLVLGYVDTKKNSSHDVWYSGFKEVIEIKDGRLANTEGLETNWTEVRAPDAPPLMDALAILEGAGSKRTPKFRYSRVRTAMPGYHVNIKETVVMEALPHIPSDIPKQLKDDIANTNIRWVQETVLVSPISQNPSIHALRAIYAINTKTSEVVYGKQYLTPNFYVSWLTWPYPKAINQTTQDSTQK